MVSQLALQIGLYIVAHSFPHLQRGLRLLDCALHIGLGLI